MRDHPALIDSAVEELLRYARFEIMAMPRVAVADVELCGQLIRAGKAVFPMLGAANHDQEVFETPSSLT